MKLLDKKTILNENLAKVREEEAKANAKEAAHQKYLKNIINKPFIYK